MSKLIHILGADIPHHNQTVLRFFGEELAAALPTPQPRQFWVVNAAPELTQRLNALTIRSFASKAQLAQAVGKLARRDRQMRFFFHGQFNPQLWLMILSGALKRHQVLWHVWGADLYEDRSGIKYRLFYALRRLAQRRTGQVFATEGDLSFFRQRCPQVPVQTLYFPTRMSGAPLAERNEKQPFTLLLGNSGDASNRHIVALENIAQQFGERVKVVVPMGYPADNEHYVRQVEQAAQAWFPPGTVNILRENLPFTDYLALIAGSDAGYFIFRRQQGIGTLCLLIQANVPLVISRHNPFWQDLASAQVPLLFAEEPIDRERVAQARQQLSLMNKTAIPFFTAGYTAGWQRLLQQLEDNNS